MDILIFAQGSGESAGGSFLTFMLIIAAMGAVFYFLMIRPQRRRVAKHQEFAKSLDLGDEIRTSGGIFGIVRRLDDETAVIEVEDGSLIRVARMAILGRVTEPEPEAD